MRFTVIGQSIKARRKVFQLTQEDLAEMAEVSPNTIYKIERGQANPTLGVLASIGEVLGMELTLSVLPTKSLPA